MFVETVNRSLLQVSNEKILISYKSMLWKAVKHIHLWDQQMHLFQGKLFTTLLHTHTDKDYNLQVSHPPPLHSSHLSNCVLYKNVFLSACKGSFNGKITFDSEISISWKIKRIPVQKLLRYVIFLTGYSVPGNNLRKYRKIYLYEYYN